MPFSSHFASLNYTKFAFCIIGTDVLTPSLTLAEYATVAHSLRSSDTCQLRRPCGAPPAYKMPVLYGSRLEFVPRTGLLQDYYKNRCFSLVVKVWKSQTGRTFPDFVSEMCLGVYYPRDTRSGVPVSGGIFSSCFIRKKSTVSSGTKLSCLPVRFLPPQAQEICIWTRDKP